MVAVVVGRSCWFVDFGSGLSVGNLGICKEKRERKSGLTASSVLDNNNYLV